MRGFIILDFGSQFTQLIARRLRELGFYSEIHPYHLSDDKIQSLKPLGIILSGGPNSVYESESPQRDVKKLLAIAPVMGVCYGMQLLSAQLGGVVEKADHREYGLQKVFWKKALRNIPAQQNVWMSHGDVVKKVPSGFSVVAESESGHIASFLGERCFAVQFHPEVAHTDHGQDVISYFAEQMCEALPTWKPASFKKVIAEKILAQVGPQDHVLMGLSGGVDSTVVATLLSEVLGAERVHCIFVNNGLLRKNEYDEVLESYRRVGLNVQGVDAEQSFLSALVGVTDPEKKRKTIGKLFIEVFEQSMPQDPRIKWLAQGTLYPDVIESVSSVGGSVTIKSHHNVGGLPEKMKLKLLEPVRELFKDEVRELGKELGLPHHMLWRHPFPGPGLAVRILGEVSSEKLEILKAADQVFIQELRRAGIYDKIWQAFCVLLPVRSVGVQGDSRSYSYVLSLRAVTSVDGMTADWYPFEMSFLRHVSNLITNQVPNVNRVVYDITSKPPATIEWE